MSPNTSDDEGRSTNTAEDIVMEMTGESNPLVFEGCSSNNADAELDSVVQFELFSLF